MNPQRLLPGLGARDPSHDQVLSWHRLGSILKSLVRANVAGASDDDLRRQLVETQRRLQEAALEIDAMRLASEGAHARQMAVFAFVAHELRNPLAPIRTAVAVLGLGSATDHAAMQTMIERQVAQMSRMIDDLLDVSRASTGRLRLVLGRVRVDELVLRAAETAAPTLRDRGQRLDIVGLDGAGDLVGDLTRLIQVLSNLLGNASKYSPEGGLIRLAVASRQKSVELAVIDAGIGMSTQALQNVFSPFVQEAHAVRYNATGLGIGLAVVRDIVEAHGGRITAASDGLGQGSRFVATLPRNAADEGTDTPTRMGACQDTFPAGPVRAG